MVSDGQAFSEVEEVLRVRANARRIKEHYDGTLGVPSELKSLSHLLAHDRDAVFAGLEQLPFYNKTELSPSTPLRPAPEPSQNPQPPRRRTPVHPISMPSFSAHLLTSPPTGTGAAGTPPLPSPSPSPPLESEFWPQNPATPISPPGAVAATTDGALPLEHQLPAFSAAATAPLDEQQEQQEQVMHQYPLEPGSGPKPGGRVLLPSGFTLDPWRWTPSEEELGQAFDAATIPPEMSESILIHPTENRLNSHVNHHNHPYGHGRATNEGGSSPVHLRPLESRTGGSGGAASPPPPQQQLQLVCPSPTSSPPRAGSPVVTAGQTHGSQSGGRFSPAGSGGGCGSAFGGFLRSQGGGGTGFGSGNGSGSGWGTPTATGFGSMPSMSAPPLEAVAAAAAVEEETEEERKARLARQRLLSANDLTPQEWARIGLPKDAAYLERFVARSYSMAVDFDRRTLMPQRVARPNIFHISAAEVQRRQLEADEATLAMQALRRAEAEAQQAAEEQERQARNAARGPWYDTLGVRQVKQSTSPVLPRYLDWHPGGVIDVIVGGGGSGGSGTSRSSPRGSRCVSAARSQSESLHGTGGGGAATRRLSAQEQVLRQSDPMGFDPYVYEDYGDDPDLPAGGGAAYGTRPPRRRHHSAIAASNSFAPSPRPAGVSDAHYAQMVRQQRKWLNAPAQPPRPLSAAPLPAPMSQQYVRPRSSRPWPDGTAAPIPSRVVAEAAAAAEAAEAASRHSTAFRTVIHPKSKQLPPRPGDAGRTSFRTLSTRTSARSGGILNAAAFISAISAAFPAASGSKVPPPRHVTNPQDRVDGGAGGAAAAAAAVAQLPSSLSEAPLTQLGSAVTPSSAQLAHDPPRNAKQLPWEAREHVAMAAAVGIIPTRLSLEGGDTPLFPPGGGNGGGRRRSTTEHSPHTATAAAGGGGRRFTVSSSIGSNRRQSHQPNSSPQPAVAAAVAAGPAGAARAGLRRSSSVFGETLPPGGSWGRDSDEQFVPRKFELREGLVLDGYMGR